MISNLDELIEKNLGLICEVKDGKMHCCDFLYINNKSMSFFSDALEFAQEMEILKLIKINKDTCTVTKIGENIYKKGGWLKHLEAENILFKKQLDLQKKEDVKERIRTQKLIDDSQISRLNAKYRHLPYVFTGVGLVISIISLIISIKSNKEPISEMLLSKPELIKIIDSVSTSSQTKKDSLLPLTNYEPKK